MRGFWRLAPFAVGRLPGCPRWGFVFSVLGSGIAPICLFSHGNGVNQAFKGVAGWMKIAGTNRVIQRAFSSYSVWAFGDWPLRGGPSAREGSWVFVKESGASRSERNSLILGLG
jgi:hypothetical protein